MNSRERLPLRRFAEYVVQPGHRPSLVLSHRSSVEEGYRPIYDPYRSLIRAVVRMHDEGLSPASLETAVNRERTARRREIIAQAMSDYIEWLTGVNVTGCFPVPAADWRCEEACVRVNPEIGLVLDGERVIIKLHFAKGSPISADEAAVMTTIMRESLDGAVASDCRMAVLDVRSGTLHLETPSEDRILRSIRAAAADLADRWNQAS